MDWYSSGWAVEKVENQNHFVWIRTPYTPEYFKAFAPLANSLSNIRVNAEGTIDIQYMAKIGNEGHLAGNRPEKTAPVNPEALPEEVERLKTALAETFQHSNAIVETGVEGVSRLHETRVCIHPGPGTRNSPILPKIPGSRMSLSRARRWTTC